MAAPQLSSTYIAKSIQNAAIAYRNARYIAPEIFPIVTVPERQGKYFTFDSGEIVQDAASPNRQPGTDAPRGGYTATNASFECEEWAFAHEVPDEIIEQSDSVIQPLERGIEFAIEKSLLRRERRTAEVAFVASTWNGGTDASGFTQWSDLSNCDVVSDINTGVDTILQNTGWQANTLLIGRQVWSKLLINPDLKDAIKYVTRADQAALEMAVAGWMGLEKIIVGGASYNAAAEGATTSREFIWGKNALLFYRPSAPAKNEPAAGYLFQQKDIVTDSWREDSPHQTVVQASICGVPVMTASKAGYYFPSVVA